MGVGGVLALGAAYLAYEAIASRVGNRKAALAGGGSSNSDGRSSAVSLVGQTGVVTSDLRPRGVVDLGNETWSGVAVDNSHVPAGRRVRVVSVDGLLLTVEPVGNIPTTEGQE